jgi:hypothetical protein
MLQLGVLWGLSPRDSTICTGDEMWSFPDSSLDTDPHPDCALHFFPQGAADTFGWLWLLNASSAAAIA